MIELFKQRSTEGTGDVKIIRDSLTQFIKEQLSKVQGGEGSGIRGLQLFLNPGEEEQHLYESAVYYGEGDRFKSEEVQRIADDFAIDLPRDWTFETSFVSTFPAEAMPVPGLKAALFVRTHKTSLPKSATAYIKILNGEAERSVYPIHSADGPVNIGREKKVLGEDGFFRVNTIAFPAESSHESNKFISRQHAHIQFDQETGHFLLYADEGGIPPRNKIKVRSLDEPTPIKLYSTRIGHELKEGDQVMLGQSAIFEFSFKEA